LVLAERGIERPNGPDYPVELGTAVRQPVLTLFQPIDDACGSAPVIEIAPAVVDPLARFTFEHGCEVRPGPLLGWGNAQPGVKEGESPVEPILGIAKVAVASKIRPPTIFAGVAAIIFAVLLLILKIRKRLWFGLCGTHGDSGCRSYCDGNSQRRTGAPGQYAIHDGVLLG
jgi:hypothetical protein